MELPFSGFELTFIIIAFIIFSVFSIISVCVQPDAPALDPESVVCERPKRKLMPKKASKKRVITKEPIRRPWSLVWDGRTWNYHIIDTVSDASYWARGLARGKDKISIYSPFLDTFLLTFRMYNAQLDSASLWMSFAFLHFFNRLAKLSRRSRSWSSPLPCFI